MVSFYCFSQQSPGAVLEATVAPVGVDPRQASLEPSALEGLVSDCDFDSLPISRATGVSAFSFGAW